MSDETTADNAIPGRRPGRPVRRHPQTRGRPADAPKRAAAAAERFDRDDHEEFLDDDGRPLTRRTLSDASENRFDIPEEFKKRGWDYEWKTTAINLMPVDGAEITDIYEAGWRPVRAEEMPRLCAPGWTKNTIERAGQMLYKRPMSFSDESRRELRQKAERQKSDKLKSALAGPVDSSLHSNRTVTELRIEGEVGSEAQQSG